MKFVTAPLVIAFALFAGNVEARNKIDLGGALCAVCTVINGLIDQLHEVHSEDHNAAFSRLCSAFPSPYSGLCSTYKLLYGRQITKLLKAGETADTACMSMGMCKKPSANGEMCHLYPTKLAAKNADYVNEYIKNLNVEVPDLGTKGDPQARICNIPLIGSLACSVLNIEAFQIQSPKRDNDGDGFGTQKELRGSAWRGKDCADRNANIYPGRMPAYNDGVQDTNCNGIFGTDPETGKPYEELFCADSGARGVIALGDSVTANFHVPGQWFNATILSPYWFQNLTFLMDQSLNWPQTSLYTGYEDSDWPIIDGTTTSVYRKLRERNLCNHRDYQNIGVNGATTQDGPEYSKAVERHVNTDKPALVIFSYIGNDVCKYVPNEQGQVTTPAQARRGLLETLTVLNTKIPKDSHVMVVAVADARPIFAGMLDKIHPFGSVRKDVTYAAFYDWLHCIGLSPCRGWLTSDTHIQNITAERTAAINAELERTVNEYKSHFSNFDLTFFPNPVLEAVDQYVANGGESWQLVEAFDGFHPNQKAHNLVGQLIWSKLEKDFPHLIGPVNPHNDRIRQLFGDQGGH